MDARVNVEGLPVTERPPFFRRLYVQLVLFGAFAMAFAILLFSWKTGYEQSKFALESIRGQAETLAINVASAAGNYIVVRDFGALEELLLQSASYPGVMSLKVADASGQVYGHVSRRGAETEPVYGREILKVPVGEEVESEVVDDVLGIWVPIESGGLGWVRLDFTLEQARIIQADILRNGFFTAMLAFAISVFLLVLLLRRPMKAIDKATGFARGLYKTDGSVMPLEQSAYEVEQLEHALNFAAHKIYSSNKDLNDLKAALDAHAVVGISDRQGKLTYVNDRFCELSGYERDELIGQGYDILNSGYHDGAFYRDLWETIMGGRIWTGELRDRRKDGSFYWVDTTIVPFLDETNEPYQFVGIQTDITERKHAEEVNVRLGRILDDSANEIYVCNIDDYGLLQVNRGARENLGYEDDVLATMTFIDINPEYSQGSFSNFLRPLLENDWRQLNFESVHQRADGSCYPVEVHLQISKVETPYVLVAIVQDISERKEAARKLREYQENLEDMVEERTNNLKIVNRELESFCYSVSHDLRTPLRSIDGFSQALLEDYGDQLDTQASSYLERVCASSQRMGELIDDLLKLSRVVRSDMNMTNVDMSKLADRVIEQLREREPGRDVEFVNTKGLCATGDERLILTMLENLLGNAWKFTARTAETKIEFGEFVDGEYRAFYIRDNGAGFDENYKHKLFEPFQRLHSNEDFEGSGIGLATVQRIIRRHNGDVWAKSGVDAGATIYFTLGDE